MISALLQELGRAGGKFRHTVVESEPWFKPTSLLAVLQSLCDCEGKYSPRSVTETGSHTKYCHVAMVAFVARQRNAVFLPQPLMQRVYSSR